MSLLEEKKNFSFQVLASAIFTSLQPNLGEKKDLNFETFLFPIGSKSEFRKSLFCISLRPKGHTFRFTLVISPEVETLPTMTTRITRYRMRSEMCQVY